MPPKRNNSNPDVAPSPLKQLTQTVTSTLLSPLRTLPNPTTTSLNAIAPQFLTRPKLRARMLSAASPSELIRSRIDSSEMQFRAVTYLPDEVLSDIPEGTEEGDGGGVSLMDGFRASLPDGRRRHKARSWKALALGENGVFSDPADATKKLDRERKHIQREHDLLSIRKSLAIAEIRELDIKIQNLQSLRHTVVERMGGLEQQQEELNRELEELDTKLGDLNEETELVALESEAGIPPAIASSPTMPATPILGSAEPGLSESIYGRMQKSTSEIRAARRRRATNRRKSMRIQHELMTPGANIRTVQTHGDSITALDFDMPFGTMVTASMDDTVRVWDLGTGRCKGLLEGHAASVRCLQIEDTVVATGSMDATIRIWDLSRSETYGMGLGLSPLGKLVDRDDDDYEHVGDDISETATEGSLQRTSASDWKEPEDCCVYTLDSHVGEVTALHFHGNTLVSGSADKTLRQWDLTTGRVVQTLDILWAVASSSNSMSSLTSSSSDPWTTPSTPFVGALQCFEAAMASGTLDGQVRLWDLRSGQVARTLIGHTGPITTLQFDDVHVVTGSLDRSIRTWDLRMGTIVDAYAYESDRGILGMGVDARRIVAGTGEGVVRVYERAEGRHWSVGPGAQGDGLEMEMEGKCAIERVRCKEGYLVEGRRDGVVGVWSMGH
ncbi:hypothetical protein G7K_6859-t1 [Saitoella complicata NRRL Y-17804]|uniref:Uncharacterized protein n=2 Tax=Saitoella complicata (strain BCRC 22490 / CBS 7301 / JCM 7358 / NBRC 10748 / NRRL Y-17804) TaxID=698492 RepID=A0A0E9NSC0_SAICN|nr:hypothetical protein G7K_6859-t1 [Saitoella complicata NRRL Y-17804]